MVEDSKTEWPELVGVDVDEANEAIQREARHLYVKPVRHGSAVIRNVDERRVWLRYDPLTRKVTTKPKTG